MQEPQYRNVNRSFCKGRRTFFAILVCFVGVAILIGCLAFIRPSTTGGKSKRETVNQNLWENMRLPDSLAPSVYEIDLEVDMMRNFYTGKVTIEMNVYESTNTIILHEVRLNITSVLITHETDNIIMISKEFEYKPNEYYVIQTTPFLEKQQKYILTIIFNGFMESDLSGFYSSFHVLADKTRQKVASTFFSPISARKAFPCFDEPKFKAVFKLTLSHSDVYRPLANMPIKSQNSNNGRLSTEFLPTLKMSTYIVCWVISDFTHLEHKTKNGLVIKTWAPQKDLPQTRYGLKNSEIILEHLEEYFEIKFPLNKLDIVAVPNFGPGAMENWGLITFRSERLLVNENTTSAADKQRAFQIMGHELVHQWFGNLATMKFWTDAWLKEGFANYVFLFLGDEIQPEMELMKSALNEIMLPALDFDSYASSHPISTKASTPDEIRQIFDTITYQKGSCMVQLLQNYLGREQFRKGLQKYLKVYSYKNADQDDLWRELSIGSNKPVKDVMDTWTLQLGFPVVTIRRENKTHYHVQQKRFSLDTPDTDVPDSPFNYTWKVPILYRPITSHNIETYLLEDNEGYIESNDDIILNPDHVIYYRVNYDDIMIKKLMETLNENINATSVQDRTGIISDVFSMVAANLTHVHNAMDILDYIQNEYDYYPWREALNQLMTIYGLLEKNETRGRIRDFVLNITKTISKEVGWKEIEEMNKGLLQVKILKIACTMGDDDVIKNATEYYEEWMATGSLNVPKNLRSVVRECTIRQGTEKYWNFAYSKYLEGGIEKVPILNSLAMTTNGVLLERLLEWSLNSSKIHSQDAPYLIGNIATQSRIGRELAWQFVKKHWELLLKRYGDELFLLDRLLSSVLSGFYDEPNLKDITEFFSTKSDIGSGQQAVKQSITQIKSRIAWLNYNQQNLEIWLKNRLP